MALQASPEDVARVVEEEQLHYPILLAGVEAARRLRIGQLPTTYVLDAQGRVRGRDAGWAPAWWLRMLLARAR